LGRTFKLCKIWVGKIQSNSAFFHERHGFCLRKRNTKKIWITLFDINWTNNIGTFRCFTQNNQPILNQQFYVLFGKLKITWNSKHTGIGMSQREKDGRVTFSTSKVFVIFAVFHFITLNTGTIFFKQGQMLKSTNFHPILPVIPENFFGKTQFGNR
jgi:hypothetical protein